MPDPSTCFTGPRPKYTDTDAVSDMVAVFDDLPKHLSTRLVYNGKQQEAQAWTMMLKQSLGKRMSVWAYAVIFQGYSPVYYGPENQTEEKLIIHQDEVKQAYALLEASASFFINMISRETTEGYTLVELILGDDKLVDNGNRILRYVSTRGLACTKKEVQAVLEQIDEEVFTLGAQLHTHEETYVRVKRLFESIHPNSRGGQYALQEHLFSCVPDECATEINNLRQQIDTNQILSDTYPTPEELLRLISPIVRACKPASTFATYNRDANQRDGHRHKIFKWRKANTDKVQPTSTTTQQPITAIHSSTVTDTLYSPFATPTNHTSDAVVMIMHAPKTDAIPQWHTPSHHVPSHASQERVPSPLNDTYYQPFERVRETATIDRAHVDVQNEGPFQQWRAPSHLPSTPPQQHTPQMPSAQYCLPCDDVCTPVPRVRTYAEVLHKGGRAHVSTAIDNALPSNETPALDQDHRVMYDTPPKIMAHVREAHEPMLIPSVDDMMDVKSTADVVTKLMAAHERHDETPIRYETDNEPTPSPSSKTQLTGTDMAHAPNRDETRAAPAMCTAFWPVSNRMRATADTSAAMRKASTAKAPALVNVRMDHARDMRPMTTDPMRQYPKNGDTYGKRRPTGKNNWGKSDKTSRERARRANNRKKAGAENRRLRREQVRMDEQAF